MCTLFSQLHRLLYIVDNVGQDILTGKLEDYLSTLKNFNSRKILTKVRISDHKLKIEIGRYKKVPREQRICKACKVLDDEKHFFLHCHINYNIRNPMCTLFSQLHRLLYIVDNVGQDILTGI
jgi:hypothetical protein